MPFYSVEFYPPKEYTDLESICAVTLQHDANQAIEAARFCIEADWCESGDGDAEGPLEVRLVRQVDEEDYWALNPCPVHPEVSM